MRRLINGIVSQWRVLILAATGFALSVASGVTTFEGLWNFTADAKSGAGTTTSLIKSWLLCILITFGIQGVMMISALMIGDVIGAERAGKRGLAVAADKLRTSGLMWPLFFCSMAASTFFSFDGLFNYLLPQAERERTAVARTQMFANRMTNEIGEANFGQRKKLRDRLIETKEWLDYEKGISRVITLVGRAPEALETERRKVRDVQNTTFELQKDLATQSLKAAATLEERRKQHERELPTLISERDELAATVLKWREMRGKLINDVEAKKIQIKAEENGETKDINGNPGTGKKGCFQECNKLKAQLDEIQLKLKAVEGDLREKEPRFDELKRRAGAAEADAKSLPQQISAATAKAKTANEEAKRADDLLRDLSGGTTTLQSTLGGGRVRETDADRLTKLLGNLRDTYEQPVLERLTNTCTEQIGALSRISDVGISTEAKSLESACDTKAIYPLLAPLLDLTTGIAARSQNCVKPLEDLDNEIDAKPSMMSGIAATATVDRLINVVRTCIRRSGLGMAATGMLNELRQYDSVRDDKAHRFIVSINYLRDLNWLALLALAIAVLLDGLVLVVGLLSGKMVSAPLTRTRAYTGSEIKELVSAALGGGLTPYGNEPPQVRQAKKFLACFNRQVPAKERRAPVEANNAPAGADGFVMRAFSSDINPREKADFDAGVLIAVALQHRTGPIIREVVVEHPEKHAPERAIDIKPELIEQFLMIIDQWHRSMGYDLVPPSHLDLGGQPGTTTTTEGKPTATNKHASLREFTQNPETVAKVLKLRQS